MKVIGQLLLWLGFLSGALATVFRSQSSGMQYVKNLKAEDAEGMRFQLPDLSGLELPTDDWSLIPWAWYLVSVGVAAAGVVVLYMSKASEGQKSEKTQANLKEIKKSLDSLINNTVQLRKQLDDLAP